MLTDAEELLDALFSKGIVVEPNSSTVALYEAAVTGVAATETRDAPTFGVYGAGSVADKVFRELCDLRSEGIERLATWNEFSGDVLVMALDNFEPSLLAEGARFAIAQGMTFFAAYVDGRRIVLGPTVIPGRGPCYQEAELQLEATVTRPNDHAAFLRATERVTRVLGLHGSLAAAYAAAALLPVMMGDGSESFLSGKVLVLDFEDFALDLVDVVRTARCPACRRESGRHVFG